MFRDEASKSGLGIVIISAWMNGRRAADRDLLFLPQHPFWIFWALKKRSRKEKKNRANYNRDCGSILIKPVLISLDPVF